MDNFPKGAFIAPFGFAGKGRVVGEVSDPSKGRAALLSGGESVKGAEPPCPPTGRPATNEVCLALVRQADAGSVLSARGPGGEKPPNWVGWVGNVWIKGVACRFSLLSFLFATQRESWSILKRQSLVDKG